MIDIGQYLDDKPVNCVFLVLRATQHRISPTEKQLLNILATKITPSDYDKLGVIVNEYNHDVYSVDKRRYHFGMTEGQIQTAYRADVAASLKGKLLWYHH